MRIGKVFPTVVAILVAGLCTSFADAQPWRNWQGSGGWGMGSPYQRLYDSAAVITVTGEVASVQETVLMQGMMPGIHLDLKTAEGELPVHLGPAWYVERLDTSIEVGDRIEVKGSRVTFDGKPALIAGEIRKGDTVLVLRNESGIPVWAGWRRR